MSSVGVDRARRSSVAFVYICVEHATFVTTNPRTVVIVRLAAPRVVSAAPSYATGEKPNVWRLALLTQNTFFSKHFLGAICVIVIWLYIRVRAYW